VYAELQNKSSRILNHWNKRCCFSTLPRYKSQTASTEQIRRKNPVFNTSLWPFYLLFFVSFST